MEDNSNDVQVACVGDVEAQCQVNTPLEIREFSNMMNAFIDNLVNSKDVGADLLKYKISEDDLSGDDLISPLMSKVMHVCGEVGTAHRIDLKRFREGDVKNFFEAVVAIRKKIFKH